MGILDDYISKHEDEIRPALESAEEAARAFFNSAENAIRFGCIATETAIRAGLSGAESCVRHPVRSGAVLVSAYYIKNKFGIL